MLNWFGTLKFKIVALAVATGVLSAVGTAELVLRTTRDEIERQLLENGASNRQSTAALMATKLDLLQRTLTAMARNTDPALWQDPNRLSQYLQQETAVVTLFDTVLAATAQGQIIVRLIQGKPTGDLPMIADRPYFQQAMKTDQVVISEPLTDWASNTPLVIMAMAAPPADGKPTGIVAGAITLASVGLFSNLGDGDLRDGSRSMVMNRNGKLLAHPEPARVLGNASDEPGLGQVYTRWRDSGSPIDTDGSATLSEGYLISMAGIAVSDWMLVRMTPQAIALQPVHSAQRTAWLSAAGVGLGSALLAGWVAWLLTRPITRLRARAETLLHDDGSTAEPWPAVSGELADLTRALVTVEELRRRRHDETHALLQQLEAVMDHAQIGIALTRNGQFELVSQHLCHVLGIEKRAIQGQSTRMIYACDEAFAEMGARARPQFMEQGFLDGEVELMRSSGVLFWAHLRGRAVVAGDMAKGTIWTFEDITDTRAHRERLTWSASHDALTGLANRVAFEKLLAEATERAQTAPFCALFVDLDHFKQVNDTGGHAAGDAVLRDIANALAAQVRKSDTVARLGGDEFAVLLNECPLNHASEIAEKMRRAVADYRLDWQGRQFAIGASIGLVRVTGDFAGMTDVMAAADSACYKAKHRGRNCVVVHGATDEL